MSAAVQLSMFAEPASCIEQIPALAPARVQRGDLWQLGQHRLLCGDATNADDVARLMGGERAAALITDPPYGIGIVKRGTAGNFPGKNAPRLKARPIVGDDRPFDPKHLLALAPSIVLWGANHFAPKLPAGSRWLVWDKKDGAFQGSSLGDCELAWTNLGGASRLLHHTWQGMYRKGAGERSARVHPTQKPVDLMAWCVKQAKVPTGRIILDCYLGSGSTMMACLRSGHRCYGMEIEPHYCDIILRRWEQATGRHATLLERMEVGA